MYDFDRILLGERMPNHMSDGWLCQCFQCMFGRTIERLSQSYPFWRSVDQMNFTAPINAIRAIMLSDA